MKASELMSRIENATVDGLIYGNGEKEIHRVAVCFIATASVIQEAIAWGADLLVTHEPTFYNDAEQIPSFAEKKAALLASSDLTIIRWHDAAHWGEADHIHLGFAKELGWKGHFAERCIFVFDHPTTPLAIAQEIEAKLGIHRVRISGSKDHPLYRAELCLGAPADDVTRLLTEEIDLTIRGEICEWRDLEAVRDAALLGEKKAALVLGHAGSEWSGMRQTAENLALSYPELEVRYFHCGEVYTYTDQI